MNYILLFERIVALKYYMGVVQKYVVSVLIKRVSIAGFIARLRNQKSCILIVWDNPS